MALTPLATLADVQARLGRAMSDSELLRVDALLRDASASVRSYTNQVISQVVDDVVRLRVRGNRVRLPQRPVTAVASVAPINGGPIYFYWEGFDTINTQPTVLDTFGWEPFRNGIVAATITYTHGYATIPDDIIGVVCSIAIRSLGRKPEEAGIQSERFEDYSYTLGAASAGGAFGMSQAEREVLDVYRRVGGSVNVGR